MNKALKLSAQVIGSLIVVYILLMIFLYIFVQTKDFKPIVTKAFYEKTGLTLKVNGDIKLSIFPWPGITATDMTIGNPKGFPAPSNANYLAKVGKVRLTLDSSHLIRGNIFPRNILATNLTINYITSKTGKTNWEPLTKLANKKTARPIKVSTHATSSSTPENSKKDPITELAQFPVVEIINANAHFVNLKTQQKTDITNLALRSPASSEPNSRLVTLDGYITHTDPYTVLNFSAKTKLHKDSAEAGIDLNDLKVIIKWIQVKKKLNHPVVLNLKGRVHLNNKNFVASLNGNFADNDGNIYITAQRNQGMISTKATLKKVDLAPLFQVLSGTRWIEGNVDATTNLHTTGDSFHDWLNNLSGKGQFKASDGEIHGLNMLSMVTNTLNKILTSSKKSEDEKTTNTSFNTISANFGIVNGLLTTDNLLLVAKKLKATGEGRINLPNATIHMKLVTTYADNKQWQLPLIISGSLTKPKVQPDTTNIAKQLLQDKLQNDVGNTINKLKNQVKGWFD